MDERAEAVLGIFAILTALFAAIIFLFALNHFRFLAQRLPFNASQWQSRSLDERWNPPTRQRMVDDLVTGKRLDRLTREQVEALLGPDDETVHWRQWDLRYRLGPARHLRLLDWEWLVIRFVKDGRVEARIRS